MALLREEYDLLKGKLMTTEWSATAHQAVFDNCIEDGLIDHMGITTQKGQRAIEQFEGSRQ